MSMTSGEASPEFVSVEVEQLFQMLDLGSLVAVFLLKARDLNLHDSIWGLLSMGNTVWVAWRILASNPDRKSEDSHFYLVGSF